MSRVATTLDHRLYAWLAEPHPSRFERAFADYFSVAFPAVMRHLARLSRWDAAQLEELAQDALLRFFEKAGRGRREASDLIKTTLLGIRPSSLGQFHERQVIGWTRDTESFREVAMSFQPDVSESADDFKAPIRALADRIPPLQARGHQLNHVVRNEPNQDALSTGFIASTESVVNHLPTLRVPTNGYLFEMAHTIYLDECKKQGRQKRGGTGFRDAEKRGDAMHPFDQLGSEYESAMDVDERAGELTAIADFGSSDSATVPSSDPTRGYEDQELLEKFYAYLRHPLDDAIAALEARASGRASAEQKKVESMSNKFARTIAVLTLMGEGHTQEQIAAQLELSRNQVKYIIESVQDAFKQFSSGSTSGSRTSI